MDINIKELFSIPTFEVHEETDNEEYIYKQEFS
jgi:hypothetical protein